MWLWPDLQFETHFKWKKPMKKTWIRRNLLGRALGFGGALGMLAFPIAASYADDDDNSSQDKSAEQRIVVRQVIEQDEASEPETRKEEVVVEKVQTIVARADGEGENIFVIKGDGEKAEGQIQVRVEVDEEGRVEQKVIRVGQDEAKAEGQAVRVLVQKDGEENVFVVGEDADHHADKAIQVRVEVDDDGQVKHQIFVVGQDEAEEHGEDHAEEKTFRFRVHGEHGEEHGEEKTFRFRVQGEDGEKADDERVIVWRTAKLVEDADDDDSPSDRRMRIRLQSDGEGGEDLAAHMQKLHGVLKELHVDDETHAKAIQLILKGDGEATPTWKHAHGNIIKLEGEHQGVIMLHHDEDGDDSPVKVRVIRLGQDGTAEAPHGQHGALFLKNNAEGVYRVLLRNHDDEAHEHGDHEHSDHEHGDHGHSHDADHAHGDDHEEGERRVERRMIRLDGDMDKEKLKELLSNEDLPKEVRDLLRQHMGDTVRMRVQGRGDGEFEFEDMPKQEFRLRRRGGDEAEEREFRIERNVEVELELDEADIEKDEVIRLRRRLATPAVAGEFRWTQIEEDDDDNEEEEELDDRLEELEDRLIRLERKIDQLLRNRR